MEKAMSVSKEVLLSVLRQADKPGNELAPSELIGVVLNQSEPIRSFSDHDQGNIFFEAIRRQFDFISVLKVTDQRLRDEDTVRWVALMRWLIRELQEWRLENDSKFHKLTALFVVSTYCDQNNDLWDALPNGVEQNNDLLSALGQLISGISCAFQVRGFGYVPIWEREAVERFNAADAAEDWLTISELWPSFKNQIIPNVFQIQAVRCLYRFGFESLVQTLKDTNTTILVMLFADALNVGQRFRLGLASNNPFVHFGCVYQTFFHRPKMDCLDDEEQQLLTQLLRKVADDGPRWAKWMQVFNQYPLRYPALQQALGHTLATAIETAINAYIESISLTTTCNGSRQAVSECLRAFRINASPDRAKMLWRLAYRRWSEWQFELASKDKHLFKIGCSELDFPVVAYAIECMTESEREATLNKLSNELRTLDNSWHASLTDCITSWNRLLSQFQPFAHAAQSISLGEDWLMKSKHYLPFEPQSEPYLLNKFRI